MPLEDILMSCYTVDDLASSSSGRHLVLGSKGLELESLLNQVDYNPLGKALYMHTGVKWVPK